MCCRAGGRSKNLFDSNTRSLIDQVLHLIRPKYFVAISPCSAGSDCFYQVPEAKVFSCNMHHSKLKLVDSLLKQNEKKKITDL